jgi:hypothetical protein
MTDLLARLKGVEPSGDGWTARCPAHEDRHNSLSVHHRDGRWLVKCHAGCDWQAITDAAGIDAADLFDDEERGGVNFTAPTIAQLRNRPAEHPDHRYRD